MTDATHVREWEPPPDSAVEYDAERGGELVRVRGQRVGHFAVRPSFGEWHRQDGELAGVVTRGWSIDHIPSCASLVDAETFEVAMRIADDVSRFAVRDTSARCEDFTDTSAMLGPELTAWLGVGEGPYPCDSMTFREWQRERAECNQERA